jgi:hypothetical protein
VSPIDAVAFSVVNHFERPGSQLMLFADGDTNQVVTLGGITASLLGIVVWIFKVALPALMERHEKRLDAKETQCAIERSEHRAERKEEGHLNRQTHEKLAGAIDKLASEVSAIKNTARREPG